MRPAIGSLLVLTAAACSGGASPSGSLDSPAPVGAGESPPAVDAGGGTDAGRDPVDAGSGAVDASKDAAFVCPTAPPFDLDAPGMSACTTSVLVAVGDRTRRIVSFDGLTWEHDQIDDGNCFGGNCYDDGASQVAFGLGYIVTASDFGIFTSKDRGATWTKAPAPAPQKWGEGVHVSDVVWNGARFMVFSDTTSFVSTDGYAWTRTDIQLAGSHMGFGGVTVGKKGRVMASAGQPSLNLSDDGVTWRQVPAGAAFVSMAYGAGVAVGVGTGVRGYSTDEGETWTVLADDCTSTDPSRCVGSPSQVMFREGKFVFTANDVILESPNGKDWTKAGKGYGFDWAHTYFAGQDFAVGWPGDKYRVGATAGGPWVEHVWPSTNTQGIGRIVAGRVLRP